MKFFLALGRPHLRLYIAAFVLLVATNLCEVYWIRVTGVTVERIVRESAALGSVLLMTGVAVVIFFLRWFNRNLSFLAGRRVERELRERVFAATLELPQNEIDRHRTGDLVSRIINDISDVRMVLGSGFLQIANTTLAYITTLTAMFAYTPDLAIAGLIPFLPLVFLAKKLTALSHERSQRSQTALGSLSATVEESIGGIEVIKSYSSAAWQTERFRRINEAHYEAESSRVRPDALLAATMGSAVWLGIVAILLAAGYLITHHAGNLHRDVGDLATFIFLFSRLVWPSVALGWIINVIQRGSAATQRIRPLLETPLSSEAAPAIPPQSGASGIECDRLSFLYPTRSIPALNNITLSIRDGEWIGIVGPTGSGKTTLARVLAGLREPTGGSVAYRGRAIASLPPAERKRQVHLVTQTPILFSVSIRENLAMAAPPEAGLTDEAAVSALADAAFSDDLTAMTDGLGTVVGERGLMLSGGQRQRVALARGYLANADVLILDDVLSAVDLETEMKILAALERRRRGRTTIFITHRFFVLSRMDRVLVMEDGGVAVDAPLADAIAASEWLSAASEVERIREDLEKDELPTAGASR